MTITEIKAQIAATHAAYAAALPIARKMADTMAGAAALMKKHGTHRILDAIEAEAKEIAFR